MADGRFYMNKMFGHGLDQAREADELDRKHREHGGLKRITVEPDHKGGHHVIVERMTMVGVPHGEGGGHEEHNFATPEEMMQFMHAVMHGDHGEPADHGEAADHGEEADHGDEGTPAGDRHAEMPDDMGREMPSDEEENENGEGDEDEGNILGRLLSRGMPRRS